MEKTTQRKMVTIAMLEKTKKTIDYWGAALFTISMGSLLFALISGGAVIHD